MLCYAMLSYAMLLLRVEITPLPPPLVPSVRHIRNVLGQTKNGYKKMLDLMVSSLNVEQPERSVQICILREFPTKKS